MQITIAITRLIISKGAFVCLIYVPISSIVERSLSSLRAFKEWRKRKCENADGTKQIADGTKQIEDDTKQIEDDTKQIEDHTKQNKRRQSSWDPNSVGLGLGYFERVKLSHSCN
ncbi:hypothetical protein T07_13273 [Trichinella nelsoni]|uniref:Uncharacterized protein n=1 Tax=Trichinella nelsoni TaxID=6336 RepID=A0A0V0RLU4_9BILA|nr:hypothetical protein T07_13273 [Trichinella nelsoni]